MATLVLSVCLVGCASPKPAPRGPREEAPVTLSGEDSHRVRQRKDAATGYQIYSVVPNLAQSRAGKLSMAAVLMERPGDASGALTSGQFGFQTSSKKVRFRECRRLVLIVDGQRLPQRAAKYYSSIGNGVVVEGMVAPVSLKELRRLSRGESVAYRLCSTSGTISSTDKALIRRMLEQRRSDTNR